LLHISSLLLSCCDCAVQVLLSRVFPLPAIVSWVSKLANSHCFYLLWWNL
jgi:hypothetical protein